MGLVAMKTWFLIGCRPIIRVDACFLKGPFKGQLMSAVGKDVNDNMYPIPKLKLSARGLRFLEMLMGELGPGLPHRGKFISERQKVIKFTWVDLPYV